MEQSEQETVNDKCSKHIQTDAVETVTLVQGGHVLVLMMCARCRENFSKVWLGNATSADTLVDAKQVRAWYKQHGAIGDRGRIPGFVWAAYQAWTQRHGSQENQ